VFSYLSNVLYRYIVFGKRHNPQKKLPLDTVLEMVAIMFLTQQVILWNTRFDVSVGMTSAACRI